MPAATTPATSGTLRDLLVACRGRIQVSQEQVAIEVGVSGRHYGDLERGRVRRPNPVLLTRVAEVLKMSSVEQAHMHSLLDVLPTG
ncbi:helix-turn-helix transcriptional regulator [Kitasatospora sp. NPDC058046]|uniref:helix-turn-helix transcriptional regulator n=1 Tax=Kitasatospora sp. NPDC058046 TaxID=3346312 RepID=UPI0036DE74CF